MKNAARRWHGELEGLDSGLLYGWCLDSNDPEARVVIEIRLDDALIGTVTSDVARTDLLSRFEKLAGKSADACHGFVADLRQIARGLAGTLTARIANTGHTLDGHTRLDDAGQPPAAASSFVFGEGGLRLRGWCKPADPDLGCVVVRAYVGAREVASTRADQVHPALRHFGIERDGFVLDLPPELADGRTHLVRVVNESGHAINGSPVTVCSFPRGARALLKESDSIVEALIDSYEKHLPRSLGMHYYPAWRREFESGEVPGRGVGLTVGLVATTPVTAQRNAKVRVFSSARAALDSRCDVIGFVRPGDDLREHAIAATLEAFARKETLAAYTDSEFEGRPWFKPAWNPDYAFASDYPLELMLVRADFARKYSPRTGSPEPAALQWHWLAAAHVSGPQAIVHVPRALYIWNSPPSDEEKAQRTQAAAAALSRIEPASRLEALASNGPLFTPRRILRPLTRAEKNIPVSLVIPTRDRVELLERCIGSIRRHTRWPGLEIIVVDNGSVQPGTHKYLRAQKRQGVRVIEHPGPFNFSRMNNRAVAVARGDIVGLVNNDIEALHDGWLDEIVGQLLRPGVGAVGGKLLWPNGMVQHGGVVLGMDNVAGHFGNRLADADWGDHGRNQLAQQVSAATAACLFLRKKDYIAVGGMEETAFPITFNDVDLCLKLRERGLAVVWTPFARLLHAESASRGKEDAPAQRARAQREIDRLRQKWGMALLRDPAYHPSLNLDAHSHPFGGLATPPRDRRPRTGALPQ